MKLNVWFSAFVIPLVGCASNPAPLTAGQTAVKTNTVLYRAGSGRESIVCQGIDVPRLCGSAESNIYLYFDCSDEKFQCLFNTHDVMAVPTVGIHAGQEYSVFGAALKVERCFGNRTTCDVALISSVCESAERCKCRHPGGTLHFYYARDIGVTAFYTVPNANHLKGLGVDRASVSEVIPLLTFVLVTEEGFLKAPLALEGAKIEATCLKQ